MVNKEKVTKEELEEQHRMAATNEFLNSVFYKNYFEPYLEKRLEMYTNIWDVFSVKGNEAIVNQVFKNAGRVNALAGIKNQITRWRDGTKKEKGGEK